MENGVLVVGKRVRGQHVMVTKGVIAPEVLDGMSKQGWVLSKVEQQATHFHYNFIRERRRQRFGRAYANQHVPLFQQTSF
ncbi:hypothetical protein BEP19_16595 [Ammoniphilus oxalaticus]|uniref:Uncharacterized protein n=1 Tax=Ammoniphilus oxalaticus TaxID=66863 RepID=A0A419SQR7_9BACL|nr:hypothetical protein [Ammoniphilus oxalaticus]RKD26813.1 hypothetical protein BEP19_16595 [Ammoniphilus oxalaticus]